MADNFANNLHQNNYLLISTLSYDLMMGGISGLCIKITNNCQKTEFVKLGLKNCKKKLQKDLNNNSPHLGYRFHSKLKAI